MIKISEGGNMTWPAIDATLPPYINLNGETAESWQKKLSEAKAAVSEAVDKLRVCAPHGRDYQTKAPFVYTAAREQHEQRWWCLNRIMSELEIMQLKVQEQADGRVV